MFTDVKLSPSKGKGKEDTLWQAGWWEFYSSPDQLPRPISWSHSSTIFTAHPTQPQVTARLFSSSKQFVLPSPSPAISSPTDYEPPSIISIGPGDDWLFAYFPGRENDGMGCLWKRGIQADSWTVKDWWSYARGDGVVAVEWAGDHREWYTSPSGSPSRRPPRGPPTPITNPTLLLVTQTHQLQVYYIRYYTRPIKSFSCPLMQPAIIGENKQPFPQDSTIGPGGLKICVKAAICLGYNESSIIIAMRSRIIPSPAASYPSFNTMDLSIPLEIPPDAPCSVDWDAMGEDLMIDLCEVQLGYDGTQIILSSRPLPPISYPATHMSHMTFICTPPTSLDAGQSTLSSPSRGKQPEGNGMGRCFLLSTYLDFGDYNSTPKSEIVLHSFNRTQGTSTKTWTSHFESSRVFTSEVVGFCLPCIASSPSVNHGVYAGIIDTVGIHNTKRKNGQRVIGNIKVLKLPNLTDDTDWLPSPILLPSVHLGGDIPLNAAISPNNMMLCTTSSSLFSNRTSIHPLPRPPAKTVSDPRTESHLYCSLIPSALVSAVHAKHTTSDITHILATPLASMENVADSLYHTAVSLDSTYGGSSSGSSLELLGIVVEVYRTKALQAGNSQQKDLTSRWRVVHDMCSLATCKAIFEDCKEEKESESYKLEVAWQLIALSKWIIEFLTKFMKECVLVSSSTVAASMPDKPEIKMEVIDDVFNERPPAEPSTLLLTPLFLHLILPYSLQNFHDAIGHVRRFRNQLASLSARGENSQIARNVLLDLVDYCGVDLSALEGVLADLVKEANAISDDGRRRSLAECMPLPATFDFLKQAVDKLTTPLVVDRPRLFIKPSDFIDSVARLSISVLDRQYTKEKETDRDVVTKALLLKRGTGLTCTRCGGKSELGRDIDVAGNVSPRWRACEKLWEPRCICGGLWLNGSL